ncbi:hypothetical protein BU25DRAFT_462953 [Macroventuria anomochaeta]|uniref:Uncharacterized protein n=1 Tax=Macroventuria anomochaeta TaxID=301207 RepID=A0ACB6RNC9_9PLEO|nr:uncharacterized protein BU25DRAFT_462953 [Macroventuria anomochaeta]KAF2622419.1 hypothetical protein BU25DRAFT_462953 [Macroventuria anomochaeta]
MVFRARRHNSMPRTLCEHFIEEQVVTFFRTYFPMGGPNFAYGPVMERATRFVMYIDLLRDDVDFRAAFFAMFQKQPTTDSLAAAVFLDRELANLLKVLLEAHWSGNGQVAASRAYKLGFYARDPGMVDQLIWGLTHQDDAHPEVHGDLYNDHFFVAVLLIRHFKYHGGLVLPPLQAARIKQAVHETLVASEKALNHSTETLFMHYPNWRDSQDLMRPPGLGSPARALATVPTLTSNFSAGRPLNDRLPLAGPNPFGAIGDCCPRR